LSPPVNSEEKLGLK